MHKTHFEGNGKPPGKMPGKLPNARLRQARRRRAWRQMDVAAAVEHLESQLAGGKARVLGIDGDMVGRWERGEHQPGLYYQARLCFVFNAEDHPEDIGFPPLPGLVNEVQRIKRCLQAEAERERDDTGRGPGTTPLTTNQVDTAPPALIVLVGSNDGSASGSVEGAILALTSEQLSALQALLQGDDVLKSPMRRFDPSRRLALQRLLSAAALALVSPQTFVDSPDSDLLSSSLGSVRFVDDVSQDQFHQLLLNAWRLSDRGDLEMAERVVTSIMPRLVQSSSVSRDCARLAVHALRLLSILRAHSLKFDVKIELCRQAVGYARLCGDPSALTAALTELAVGFKYAGDLDRALWTYQEALSICNSASPLVRSRAYAASAAAFAQCGRPHEAQIYIDLAYEAFPDVARNDPNDVFADSGIYMLAYYKGVMYLELGKPTQADEAFESYKAHPGGPATPERNRLEILNHQARAAIQMRDLERYVWCLEAGLRGATAIGSRKRFDEAVSTLWHEVPPSWQSERRIRQIGDQFQIPITRG